MRNAQHRVIGLPGRLFQSRADVAGFEERVVFENFLAARTSRQKVEHVLYTDAQSAQAGPPAALVRIDGNPVQFTH